MNIELREEKSIYSRQICKFFNIPFKFWQMPEVYPVYNAGEHRLFVVINKKQYQISENDVKKLLKKYNIFEIINTEYMYSVPRKFGLKEFSIRGYKYTQVK